ncbi:hypothetical protein CGRA01v4_11779 [Colletotrichum graminicola]|nr:hypothetical protein CGRA01v4_11779 [Colletotrichum graminicola]
MARIFASTRLVPLAEFVACLGWRVEGYTAAV